MSLVSITYTVDVEGVAWCVLARLRLFLVLELAASGCSFTMAKRQSLLRMFRPSFENYGTSVSVAVYRQDELPLCRILGRQKARNPENSPDEVV